MNLFEYGKKIINKNPRLLNISSSLYNKIFYRRIIKKGSNNVINKKNSFLRNCSIFIEGNNNQIYVGEKSVLSNCVFYIRGSNNIVQINDLVCAYNTDFHIEDNNNQISVGKGTLFSGKAHLACIEGTSILVGNDCLFSSDIVIRTGDSHSILDLNGDRTNFSKSIIVSDHVWVGHRVLINKGVVIRKNSIVATGAVVTSPIEEENTIIGGVPSKIIKRDVNWDKNRI